MLDAFKDDRFSHSATLAQHSLPAGVDRDFSSSFLSDALMNDDVSAGQILPCVVASLLLLILHGPDSVSRAGACTVAS